MIALLGAWIGQLKAGGFHFFKGEAIAPLANKDSGAFVVAASQGAKEKQIIGGIGEDDPLAASGADNGTCGKGHGRDGKPKFGRASTFFFPIG